MTDEDLEKRLQELQDALNHIDSYAHGQFVGLKVLIAIAHILLLLNILAK